MSRGITWRTSLRADGTGTCVLISPPWDWLASARGARPRDIRGSQCRVNCNRRRKRVESSHEKGALAMPNAPYRIHAVRYAHRKCTSSEAFYGDYHASPMTMDYFVWALTNGAHTVV